MLAKGSSTGALRPGDVVSARYRVERFLERSAQEESYAVRALEDGRPLLLKLVVWPGGQPELSKAELQAWKVLGTRLASLRHSALAQTHELIPLDEEGRTCLVREPVELEGQTLSELLQTLGRPLSEPEVLGLAAQLGEALDAAHRLDLLHLSLSLRRIVVLPEGDHWRVKLTDLGLYPPSLAARFAEPGYLAPEVLAGQPCDARSDQFTLAVILYELLSGQPAFIGAPDEPREVVVQRVVAEDPLPLLLSQRVELALQRALSRSRGVRYPTLRDFVAALGGDVRRFAPPTVGHTKSVAPRRETSLARLWLPMVQGALWALCGLSLLFGVRKLLFPKPRPVPAIVTQADVSTAPDAAQAIEASDDTDLDLPERTDGDATGGKDDARVTTARLDPTPTADRKDGGSGGGASAGPSRLASHGTVRPAPRAVGHRRDGGAEDASGPGGADPVPTPPDSANNATVAVQIEVSSQEGKLSSAQEAKLRACLRLVRRAELPYRVVLENITGTLYVSPRGTSDEFLTSRDFRDCLKLQISGMIIPKVVTISGKAKGKTTP
jgi:serine/threonine protein kinase